MPTITIRPDATLQDTTGGSSVKVGAPGTIHGNTSDNSDVTGHQIWSNTNNCVVTMSDPGLTAGQAIKTAQVRVRYQSTNAPNLLVDLTETDAIGVMMADYAFTGNFTSNTTASGPVIQIGTYVSGNSFTMGWHNTGGASNDVIVREIYLDLAVANPPSSPTISAVPTNTIKPTISWTHNAGTDGSGQTGYVVYIFSAAQYSAGGFDPLTSAATYQTFSFGSLGTSIAVPAGVLANGTAYRAYVWTMATDSGYQRTNNTPTYVSFTPSVTIPTPTALVPTNSSTVTTSTPAVSAAVSVVDTGAILTRRSWEFSQSITFASGVIAFSDSAYINGPNTAIPWGAVGQRLVQGTWYARVRAVSQFGTTGVNTSAYSATSTFTVSHPATSTSHTPAGATSRQYATSITLDWQFADPDLVNDGQTRYRVQMWRTSNPTTILDSGLVVSTNTQHTFSSGITTAWKDNEIRWKVQTYDIDNLSVGYSPEFSFYLRDLPVVSISSPATGGVVSTATPTITWITSMTAGRTQAQYKVDIINNGTSALLASSGFLAGTATTWTPSAPAVSVGPTFAVTVTVIDNTGLTGTDTNTFTSDYVAPTTATFSLNGTNYPATGRNSLDWSGATADGTFVAWRVYRRNVGDLPWTLLSEFTDVAVRTYNDYTAPSQVAVQYAVVQAVENFGVTIEGNYVGQTTVGTLTKYMLLCPADDSLNMILHEVNGESFEDEQEMAAVEIIGRGRRVEYGTRFGIKGTLSGTFRDQLTASARTQRLQLEALRDSGLSVYLVNPFGDVWQVGMMAAKLDRVAGVALHELATFAIDYEQISAVPSLITTLPPTVDPPPTGITVSSLLVPSKGIWYGEETSSLDGTYNYSTGLIEREAVAGRSFHIQHFYNTNTDVFFGSGDVGRLIRTGKPESIALYNWKVTSTGTWADIAAGTYDSRLDTAAAAFIAWGKPFFLAPHHEPDNDTIITGKGNADFVAMWRYVVTYLRAAGVTNAVYTWIVTGYAGNANRFDPLYPGDDVVDWISWDPYGHSGQTTLANYLNSTVGSPGAGYTGSNAPYTGFYNWATAKAPGKPLMLGECGMGGDCTAANTIVDQITLATMEATYPAIKAMVWWNTANAENNEIKQIYKTGTVTGGSFTLTFGGQTATMNWNSTASQVQSALRGLSSIGSPRVYVTGSGNFQNTTVGAPFSIEFRDALRAANQGSMTASATGLTGSTPGVTVTTSRQGSSDNNYIPELLPVGATRPTDYETHFVDMANRDVFTLLTVDLAPGYS